MKMTYIPGDLFKVVDDLFKQGKEPVAAHCIAADFGMSRGIAAQFVKKMNMRNLLHEAMKAAMEQNKDIQFVLNPYQQSYGGTYQGLVGEAVKVSHVYNLITKPWTYEKPTYKDFIAALESLKKAMVTSGETLLVIPKLGCGIDGLEWPAVNRIIKYTFGDTDIHVMVCSIEKLSDDPDKAWQEVFGEAYKGYQGEPLPG